MNRRELVQGMGAAALTYKAPQLLFLEGNLALKERAEREPKPFDAVCLTFHDLESEDIVLQNIFYLLEDGYNPISVRDICNHYSGLDDLSGEKSFLVTLDDGLKSQKHALTAVSYIERVRGEQVPLLFAVMAFNSVSRDDEIALDSPTYVESGPPSNNSHEYFTKADLLAILGNGQHDLANHTLNHANLPTLTKKNLQGELEITQSRIKQLYLEAERREGPPNVLIYPYGEFNDRVIAEVKRQGFEIAFSTEESSHHTTETRYHLGRTGRT